MKLHEPMPELTESVEWINGGIKKEDMAGDKPTLIHFWSVSCCLCKEVMPHVNQLRDKYKDILNVIAVHLAGSDEDVNYIEIKKTAEEYGIKQPVLVDSARKLSAAFENQYVPAYYVFDREGKLRHFQVGGRNMKMLERRLVRVLEEMVRAE